MSLPTRLFRKKKKIALQEFDTAFKLFQSFYIEKSSDILR